MIIAIQLTTLGPLMNGPYTFPTCSYLWILGP